MERCFSYSLKGTGRDRSRYSYSISASKYQPFPRDAEIDDMIERYINLNLNHRPGGLLPPSSSRRYRCGNGGYDHDQNDGFLDHDDERRNPFDAYNSRPVDYAITSSRNPFDDRVLDPPRSGKYTGIIPLGSDISTALPDTSIGAIGYHPSSSRRTRRAVPISEIDSHNSHRSRHRHHYHERRSQDAEYESHDHETFSRHHRGRNSQLGDEGALVKYAKGRSKKEDWDDTSVDNWDASSVLTPDDSASQISRGRRRMRREDGSLIEFGRNGGFGKKEHLGVEDGGEGGYYCRDITPW